MDGVGRSGDAGPHLHFLYLGFQLARVGMSPRQQNPGNENGNYENKF